MMPLRRSSRGWPSGFPVWISMLKRSCSGRQLTTWGRCCTQKNSPDPAIGTRRTVPASWNSMGLIPGWLGLPERTEHGRRMNCRSKTCWWLLLIVCGRGSVWSRLRRRWWIGSLNEPARNRGRYSRNWIHCSNKSQAEETNGWHGRESIDGIADRQPNTNGTGETPSPHPPPPISRCPADHIHDRGTGMTAADVLHGLGVP
jgi:hypothetical protein